ncbi:MAG TPA: helix-turn-helix transcriptional regulator [Symbiobacteriaceae bacterium]|nr:helix-turn-helix transcriptional regulator [Symbiobacteriaceae bacterium]
MPDKWQRLIDLRKDAGLSQYELARRLKIGRSALGNYEMGEREPDFDTTKKLATFFGVSVDFLLGRDDQSSGNSQPDIPEEWKRIVALAQREGYTPEQVTQALHLLESIRKQQEQSLRKEREG